MKHIRKYLIGLVLISLLLVNVNLSFNASLVTNTVEAHPGRTDSSGGHKDNKNKSGLGYYHYHCSGNPAHLHNNGVCPYDNTATPSPTAKPKATPTVKLKATPTPKPTTTPTKKPTKVENTKNKADKQSSKSTVYITETGTKYHKEGCSYLKKSKIKTTLKDAKDKGLEPCSRCKPPIE